MGAHKQCSSGDSVAELHATASDRLFAELKLDDEHHEDHAEHPSRKGGYVYALPEEVAAVKAQRAAIWEWLRDIGSHLLRDGLNLTKISMPVKLFEPRSWLERMCDNWVYLELLECAADAADPVERMKYLVGFVVGGLRQQVSFGKPFNPILGETYQARYPGGATVCAEQISHHPPISSWQMQDPEGRFMFWGNGSWSASARGNSVKGHQSGENAVRFSSDGAVVTWQLPHLTIKGVLFGERNLKYGGRVHFEDPQNEVSCELEIDPGANCSFLGSFGSLFRRKKQAQDQVVGSITQHGEVVDTIHGSWLTHLEWEKGVMGGKLRRVWDVERSLIQRPQPVDGALPSDSRHREDLVHLQAGDQGEAQHWKVELEQLQRRDRKLRAEAGVKS